MLQQEAKLRPQVLGAIERAIASGLLDDTAPAALFYDLDALRARLASLAAALPEALHTVAVKACPLAALLRMVVDAGVGLEVASEGELAIAERLGLEADRVVFDSPAKTRAEIARALAHGYRLNVDNFQELARVAEAVARDETKRAPSALLRVNPVVEGAHIAATFTGGRGSKFGVAMDDMHAQILAAFDAHAWLDGLHVHAGSQGLALDVLVEGVSRVVGLAEELAARGRAPRILDIGGGLPVGYRAGERSPTFDAYVAELRARVPRLFSGPWRVMTEFGRAVFAPCAFAASRVEYTKPGRIAVIHVGADLFVRPAYRPEDWHHEVDVLDAEGRTKTGPTEPWSVAGPLCFSGDFIARKRDLPPIAPGDIVVVHDVGAYTLSMWSRYNSRPAPAVHGFDASGLTLLKGREPLADVLRFWGFP